jgi:hypothetical protein
MTPAGAASGVRQGTACGMSVDLPTAEALLRAHWCLVARVGTDSTCLILIRGNSGSGKSALAAAIRAARPRGVAIIGHDQLRREILHVRDYPGTSAVGYVDLSARYALSHGLHAVVEGILHEEIYGDMLRQLLADHRGVSRCYRYDVSFEETLRRHSTKAKSTEFGEAEMRKWWCDADPLIGTDEAIIGPDSTLNASVRRVLADCHW